MAGQTEAFSDGVREVLKAIPPILDHGEERYDEESLRYFILGVEYGMGMGSEALSVFKGC